MYGAIFPAGVEREILSRKSLIEGKRERHSLIQKKMKRDVANVVEEHAREWRRKEGEREEDWGKEGKKKKREGEKRREEKETPDYEGEKRRREEEERRREKNYKKKRKRERKIKKKRNKIRRKLI